MIEKVILDYLTEKLDVSVYLEVPERAPERYVIIEKTGSSYEGNYIFSATIAVQSIAGSLYEAAVLNEQAKAAMLEASGLPDVCRADLNSDYNFTDTTTKKYRYQAVFDLVHY